MKRTFTKTLMSLAIPAPIILLSMLCSFTRANGAERSLAGIRIFSPVSIVFSRFGGPTFQLSGNSVAQVEYTPVRPTIASQDGAATNYQAPINTDTGAPTAGASTTTQDDFDPLYDRGTRYIYDLPRKGLIYEFVSTSAGRVVEIKIFGYHSTITTSLGVGLGSNYEQVVLKYGFPESTVNVEAPEGDILTLSYAQRSHVVFRLVRNRVAAISVVAPD
jgi:hypothetical protein